VNVNIVLSLPTTGPGLILALMGCLHYGKHGSKGFLEQKIFFGALRWSDNRHIVNQL